MTSWRSDDVLVQWVVDKEKPEIAAVRRIYHGKEQHSGSLYYTGL